MGVETVDPTKEPTIEEITARPQFAVYVATWTRIFEEFLGWSESRTQEYARTWLENPGFRVWFGHDSPVKFAAWDLIPDEMHARLSGTIKNELAQRIQGAIEAVGENHIEHPDDNPSYDWAAAKARVRQIVKEYEHTA